MDPTRREFITMVSMGLVVGTWPAGTASDAIVTEVWQDQLSPPVEVLTEAEMAPLHDAVTHMVDEILRFYDQHPGSRFAMVEALTGSDGRRLCLMPEECWRSVELVEEA